LPTDNEGVINWWCLPLTTRRGTECARNVILRKKADINRVTETEGKRNVTGY